MSLRKSAEDARRVVSVRLSEAEIEALPDAASPTEGVRLALSRALMFDQTVLRLTEVVDRLAETGAGAGAETAAEIASLQARIDEIARALKAAEWPHPGAGSSDLALKIDRVQAFQSELYDVTTAAFRQVIAVRALLETRLYATSDEVADASEGPASRRFEAVEDALLKAHWDQFAETADRMRAAVFPELDNAPEAPRPAAAAAE